MDSDSKEMLLKMVVRCRKSKKHSPKKVAEPVLEIEKIPSPLFADSEINNRHKSRGETEKLRQEMLKITDI